ncbi:MULTISPECIES: sensor histidine kinase [Calothrix]|uniref:HAMP domain-containing histidine kinase n=2 Tax=Calothrix TaxID=1186 RepID=A0ABR8A2L6_9CYAN|nr:MULTISPECIES: HAMP domain-containing sensor histidine kinase [Calothrix]MBD2194019.1 HAMP domain-containing histidine kinase [Calothrix parietina FACHB-288]MBD2223026.1 HAMP domain-containing histidine kinase [Calothrix anomala FACHB-343]
MWEFLPNFFVDNAFIPHGHCYLWKPELVSLHILSDSLIALAYFSIPIALIYFVRKREDLPFKSIMLLFGAFIISCGTTHLMEIWTLWHPVYWFSGLIKAITAFISVYTAIVLLPIIPQALALPSPAQLEQANNQLKLALQELANTQAQLIHTEKMSTLGQLVGGIVYEMNNPMNFIYGNTKLAQEYAGNLLALVSLYENNYVNPVAEIQNFSEEIDLNFIKEDLPKILSSMQIGADRIQKLILGLRNFSRIDEANLKEVDIHEGIDSSLLILQNRLKGKADSADIETIKDYGKLPKVECYPGQLNQVFIYILNNAISRLKESAIKPQIRIHTSVLAESHQVIIKITDNGFIVKEDTREKILDSLFSNKSLGENVGMSISRQIIAQHNGQLEVMPILPEGLEIKISIPIKMKSADLASNRPLDKIFSDRLTII